MNEVVGVAGFALPGTFVDIMVNTQEEGAKRDSDHSVSKIVLERILVLAVAQEADRDDTKPKVVNAVTLEVTPEQAEMLDLARSVGTLSLVLRNQGDPDAASTAGATKAKLPGRRQGRRRRRAAQAGAALARGREGGRAQAGACRTWRRRPAQCVEVITGMEDDAGVLLTYLPARPEEWTRLGAKQ